MSWSISISGHGTSPASASCWYTPEGSPSSKTNTFTGDLDDVAMKSIAFIEECRAEEAAATASQVEQPTQADEASTPTPAEVPSDSASG